MKEPPAVLEVDARGLFCPIPVLRLAAALAARPVGTRALLLATDPDSVVDVESFCRETGAILVSRRQDEETLFFEVEKRAARN